MKPVMMKRLTSDEESYRACMASILGMGLDDFPMFEGLAAGMQWNAWLASELNICLLAFEHGTVATPPGLWLARMASPYQGYDWHTIVCAGNRPLHDPHPEAQPNGSYQNIAYIELLVPMDPSEPSGRFIHR